MQIVRDLAGYSYGRSDLVRRAMSKKKASVMEQERKNFVYGNEEEHVPGCISNGISEQVANHIFDEMTDFAKYAFNKSHAACYAVVSYQTAYLKTYYPVAYMAALMSSVIDNQGKLSEYIYHCRQLSIPILPPDLNEGEWNFSVSGDAIRYGLCAIKGIGREVVNEIVRERKEHGIYQSLADFAGRLSSKEINKRTIENFIWSGALDCLSGTRKEKMAVYGKVLDQANRDKKDSISGQLSLFDLGNDQFKKEITMPKLGEFEKDVLLSQEKEVLGIYVSGHPMDQYQKLWEKNVTAVTNDFLYEEELHRAKVVDGTVVTVGGILTGFSIKTTKTNQRMAFLTLEDLVGTLEIVVFPRDFERYRPYFQEEAKLFVRGRVNAEEEKPAKLICQEVIPFEQVPSELWIQFADMEEYEKQKEGLFSVLNESDGNNNVVLYCKKEKSVCRLPKSQNVLCGDGLLKKLFALYSKENVKVVEKSIEKRK